MESRDQNYGSRINRTLMGKLLCCAGYSTGLPSGASQGPMLPPVSYIITWARCSRYKPYAPPTGSLPLSALVSPFPGCPPPLLSLSALALPLPVSLLGEGTISLFPFLSLLPSNKSLSYQICCMRHFKIYPNRSCMSE